MNNELQICLFSVFGSSSHSGIYLSRIGNVETDEMTK